MKPIAHLTVCRLASLLLLGAVGCGQQSKQATASLDGRWSGVEAGQLDAECVLVVKGVELSYRGAQSKDWSRGMFVLNEKVQPMQMDMTVREIAASEYIGKTALAIYELKGDDLKLAVAEPGNAQRPSSLEGGQGIRTFSFKRE